MEAVTPHPKAQNNTNPERAYEISISDALRFGLSGEPVEGLTAGYI